jgi:hypothetical protein
VVSGKKMEHRVSKPLTIGVDLGGTKVYTGLIDAQGHLIAAKKHPTNPERGAEHVITDVLSCIAECLSDTSLACARPRGVRKLALEAGSTLGWRTYVGDDGTVIGLDRFGVSAPGDVVYRNLGFHVDNVVNHSLTLLDKRVKRGEGTKNKSVTSLS